jgi:hypothetical protein
MTSDEVAVAVAIGQTISEELDEDYVGIWTLAWHIRRRIIDVSDEGVRALATAILHGLHESAVRIGSLSEESGTFTPWPDEDGVDRVMREWTALGRDPNIGEIAWLARER